MVCMFQTINVVEKWVFAPLWVGMKDKFGKSIVRGFIGEMFLFSVSLVASMHGLYIVR